MGRDMDCLLRLLRLDISSQGAMRMGVFVDSTPSCVLNALCCAQNDQRGVKSEDSAENLGRVGPK